LHPAIYAGPEFEHLYRLLKCYRAMKNQNRSGSNYYSAELLIEQYSRFIGEIFFRKIETEKVDILSEKTPTNVLVFEELCELFPAARFIFVVRDPRDSIVSFRDVAARQERTKKNRNIGRNLFSDLSRLRQFLEAGETFHKNHHDACFLVIYEDLVAHPEPTIRQLCSFLDVEFHPDMLDTARSDDTSAAIAGG